jgi:hypothetical protein
MVKAKPTVFHASIYSVSDMGFNTVLQLAEKINKKKNRAKTSVDVFEVLDEQ